MRRRGRCLVYWEVGSARCCESEGRWRGWEGETGCVWLMGQCLGRVRNPLSLLHRWWIDLVPRVG